MDSSLTELLGIRHPIVLAPFGGLSAVALTAVVSEAGGLGSYGLYGYTPERIHATAAALRAATDRPFALNIWLPRGDEVGPGDVDLDETVRALRPMFDELATPVPAPPERFLPAFEAQQEAVLAEAPAVVSVVYGVPPASFVDAVHRAGSRMLGTATTVAEAVALQAAGVDAIVATGAEAAGHHASFLTEPEDAVVGLFALVPQVVDAVSVPVIAAGGIADRRGVRAAMALGASGVQVGTAFLRTRQSAASEAHRRAMAASRDDTTRLTRVFSGRLARGIPNRAMDEIDRTGAIAPFPAQNWLTRVLRTAAAAQGRGEFASLWAGQAAGLSTSDDATAVFAELAAGL